MKAIKKVNNREELNLLAVGDTISLWDYEMGEAKKIVSKNEKDKLSVIWWVHEMGRGYVVREEIINKSMPLGFRGGSIGSKWYHPLTPTYTPYYEGNKGYDEKIELLKEPIKLFEDSL